MPSLRRHATSLHEAVQYPNRGHRGPDSIELESLDHYLGAVLSNEST